MRLLKIENESENLYFISDLIIELISLIFWLINFEGLRLEMLTSFQNNNNYVSLFNIFQLFKINEDFKYVCRIIIDLVNHRNSNTFYCNK